MKTKYIILILVLTAALAGCKKEQDNAAGKVQPITVGDFYFSSETGEASKVGLASDNSLYWTGGDQFAVYSYNDDAIVCQDVATLFSGEGTTTGRFAPDTYLDKADWYDPDAVSLDYDFYAWYPATEVASPVAKVIPITNVRPVQSETIGFGDYLVCWAKAQTTKSVLAAGTAPNFLFAPKSALLKLTVKNGSESAITIHSIKLEADANISGEAELDLGTGVLSAGSRNVITYYPTTPIVVAAGSRSWIPVNISMLPCDATSITVTLDNFECLETLDFTCIESGKIYSKEANYIPIIPHQSLDIVNYTTQTATSNVLEANKLYYGKANCLVMGGNVTRATLNIQLFESADGFERSDLASSYTSAVTSARVIWAEYDLYNDENFGIIAADLNTLTLSKSSGVTGNALVGIYDLNDDLLWSYHIWCPSDITVYQNFESEKGTIFDSVYKLSLGQIAGEQADCPMYYQWGRKDPQGRAASLSSTTSQVSIGGASFTTVAAYSTGEATNNLAYARKNPTTFLTQNNETLYDWYPSKSTMTSLSNQENRLWNTAAATIYDPCPEGYHVAPKTLWEGTTSTKSSGNFSAGKTTQLWYVLGGGRNRIDGSVSDVSSYGIYWSSEAVPSRVVAYNLLLYFNSGSDLLREDASRRAGAFAVRCVRQ